MTIDLAEAYYAVAADMQERGEMTLRAADMLFGVADQMSAARIRQKGMQQDQDRAAFTGTASRDVPEHE